MFDEPKQSKMKTFYQEEEAFSQEALQFKREMEEKLQSAFHLSLGFFIGVIFTILMSIAFDSSAQSDSVQLRIISSEQAIGFMAHEFRISDREFKQGLLCNLGGSLLMVAGLSMEDNLQSKDPREFKANDLKPLAIGIGGLLNVLGVILQIDSRSHLSKGGRIYLTPEGTLAIKISR